MKRYHVVIAKYAQRQLDKLPDQISEHLLDVISRLAENPRPPGCKKLKGRSGYRVRSDNYRIVYEIHDGILTVEVIAVGDRKDIYE